MSREPAVGPVKPYRAPPREAFALPNGLKVVLVEDRRFPLVTARLAVRGGKAAVGPEDAGQAEALAALLTEGAGGRTALEIAEAADAIGGEVSADASQDTLVVSGFALSDKADRLLSLVADVALRPALPEAEVELRKRNMLDELQVERGRPASLARRAFLKRIYPGHPYGAAPTESSIARLSRSGLKALHGRLFKPAGALIVVMGDLPPAAARALVAERFGPWASSAALVAPAPAPEPLSGPRRVFLIDRPGSAQTALYAGNRGVPETHPEYYPLLLANQVLGGSFASRLMQDLREKKGYTYGVRSRLATETEAGAFMAAMQVRTEVTAQALGDLLGHLERIRAEPVSASELAQAKSYLAGSFTRRLETQAGVADALVHAALHRLAPDYLESHVGRVQAVATEEALAAAKRHIRDAPAVIIAVGDGARIRSALEAFSPKPVVLLDVDGNPL